MDYILSIIKFLLTYIFDFFLIYTGEFILFIITFGKHKPRFDFYLKDRSSFFVLFSEISFIIGAIFWIIIFFILLKKFT